MHVVAPTDVEYVPTSQSLQIALPLNILYLPAGHSVHVPPFGPVNPGLQVQLDIVVHPLHDAPELTGQLPEHTVADVDNWNLPASQLLHGIFDTTLLNFPAAQLIHILPLGLYPALHWHAAIEVLAIGAVEKAVHTVHGLFPGTFLNVLEEHMVHGPPSGPE